VKELSGRLRIDPDGVNAYEEGEKRVNANLLLRIAKMLDVRPDYFLQGYTAKELSNCLES
jgi:transcriptional regulator with XRE-family HTH domain